MKVKNGLFSTCRRSPPQLVRHTLRNLFLSAKKDRCRGNKRVLFGHDSEANWRWSLRRLSSKCSEGRRRVRKRNSNAWNMCLPHWCNVWGASLLLSSRRIPHFFSRTFYVFDRILVGRNLPARVSRHLTPMPRLSTFHLGLFFRRNDLTNKLEK